MITFLHFLGLAASVLLCALASAMETALYRVSRVRLRIRADKGERRAAAVLAVLDRMDAMVTTILIESNVAAYTATFFFSAQLSAWAVPQAELVTTAIIAPFFFVFTESLPKQLAYSSADRLALSLVRAFTVFRVAFTPLVWILNHLSALLRRLVGAGGDAAISNSQRSLLLEQIHAGVADEVLSEEQSRMASRIMELESISAGDAMVPLRRLVLVPAGASRTRALAEMNRGRQKLAILVDPAGRPTGLVITMQALG
ncbi:MAG: CNNM domain-containing protein, partial [Planctomycetes bacterium]|nr:CNNM domain-containing protein [Planctomycetota bacterium]